MWLRHPVIVPPGRPRRCHRGDKFLPLMSVVVAIWVPLPSSGWPGQLKFTLSANSPFNLPTSSGSLGFNFLWRKGRVAGGSVCSGCSVVRGNLGSMLHGRSLSAELSSPQSSQVSLSALHFKSVLKHVSWQAGDGVCETASSVQAKVRGNPALE